MDETVSDDIGRMKRLYGVKSDEELAQKLGVTRSAIAKWRTRDGIPAGVKQRVAEEFGPDAAFLFTFLSEGWQRARLFHNVHAVALYVYESERSRLKLDLTPERLEWWGYMFEQIEEAVRQHVRDVLADTGTGMPLIEQSIQDYEAGKISAIEGLFGRAK